MNILAGVALLSEVGEEGTFWLLTVLVERMCTSCAIGGSSYYDTDLTGLHCDIAAVQVVVKAHFPQISAALMAAEVYAEWFLSSMLLSCFANNVAIETTQRIWDTMFLLADDAPRVLFATACAFFETHAQRLCAALGIAAYKPAFGAPPEREEDGRLVAAPESAAAAAASSGAAGGVPSTPAETPLQRRVRAKAAKKALTAPLPNGHTPGTHAAAMAELTACLAEWQRLDAKGVDTMIDSTLRWVYRIDRERVASARQQALDADEPPAARLSPPEAPSAARPRHSSWWERSFGGRGGRRGGAARPDRVESLLRSPAHQRVRRSLDGSDPLTASLRTHTASMELLRVRALR